MTPQELANMVGFLMMDITKIQNYIPTINDPNSTDDQINEAHQMIDTSLQDMMQLLATACTMKQVPIDTTPLSDQDLQNKGLVDTTSKIDIIQQSIDTSAAVASATTT
jgi:hypothetical protein